MVEEGKAHARLFSGGNARRPALLALSRRTLSRNRPSSALVSARNLRVTYAELAVTTNFSFLRGASHPCELVERAAELGLAAIGIADRNTLAGVVRAHEAWKKLKTNELPKLLIGARLVFRDGTPDILAYPKDRKAYGRLSRLLSIGKRAAPKKGECLLDLKDLLDHRRGLQLIVMPPDN